MLDTDPSIINIGIAGGGRSCAYYLKKYALHLKGQDNTAPLVYIVDPGWLFFDSHHNGQPRVRIAGVADPDPDGPGMVLARELGLTTLSDFQGLYDPRLAIQLIVILTPRQGVLESIVKTKPENIRVLSYPMTQLFWDAIGLEKRKLSVRTKEMETILNGIQDFILVISPARDIIEVNKAFLRQMGLTREQVIGRKCYEIFQSLNYPCSESNDYCPLKEVALNKRPRQRVLSRVDHNGERHYIEVTIFPVIERNFEISRFIEISRDITGRKKEEEEITRRLEMMVEERTQQLNETHAKLIHKDKMASLGVLSASVVHEINNPIAGTLNLIMLMKRIINEETLCQDHLDSFRHYLDLMETENRRVSGIVSNLLAFSRQSKMELTKLNLNQLIEKTLLLNSNLLRINGVKVEKRLYPDLPEIIGSEDQLLQVFVNFVSNAAEAMEPAGGGTLSIESEYHPKINRLLVRFRDTGIGIPRKNLPRLFEPFFTTKRKGKGVGLGLSLAYGIIEEHGGAINVESEVGKGTAIQVELPLRKAGAPGKGGGTHGRH